MDPQTDVVIVGGGLAGLSAATYLARAGLNVTLFEKGHAPGGRATTREHDGFEFNRGIHALYSGGAAERVLGELEIPFQAHQPRGGSALHNGNLYEAPTGALSLLRTRLLGLGDKVELGGLLAGLAKLNAAALARTSVADWLEQTVRRPRVRLVMAALARTFVYSSALDLVSAEVLVAKLQLAARHPVLYLDGGWRTLVDGLHQAAQNAGAQIHSAARVAEVQHERGRARGVRLSDGSVHAAAAVIVATTPREAARLLDARRYPFLAQLVHGLYPAQVACLDVALSRLPRPQHAIVQHLDAPCFMSTQSQFARVAPAGGALVHTFKQLDPRADSDPEADRRDLEGLLDAAQPGWRELEVHRVFMPRIDAVGMLPTAQGGGYSGRPTPRLPELANVFLAGDWIGDGFLCDASFASARTAAQLALETVSAAPRVEQRYLAPAI